jgi:hypothetical protein
MSISENAIERLDEFPEQFSETYRNKKIPIIISGAAANWPASSWTPMTLAAEMGNQEVSATIQLPETGVVYRKTEKEHRRTLKLNEFIELMESGASCYIDQADLRQFPSLANAYPIDTLLPQGRRFANLWLGARTRSGLHYDPMDNFLVQIYGAKKIILAAPLERARLYPFPDNISKSQIDPEQLDKRRFPNVSKVKFLRGTLNPNDLLYIPRGWWHHLGAPGQSISINLWHEPSLTIRDELGAIFALGPAGWATVARDFTWHGLLRQTYKRRLYSPPPTGKQLYDLCEAIIYRIIKR